MTEPGAYVLDEQELRALSAEGMVKSVPRNAVIVNEGDKTDSLYIILSGRVKVYVSDESGREIVLGTQGIGEYFGEMVLDGGPRAASVMTLEPAHFAVIPKGKFREFLRNHPEFAIHLIEKLIRRTRVLTGNVKSLVLMDVYGRVARLLLELAVERDGKLVIAKRLTKKDIASRLGASRETVSLILKDLTAGGYIRHEGYSIVIEHTPPPRW